MKRKIYPKWIAGILPRISIVFTLIFTHPAIAMEDYALAGQYDFVEIVDLGEAFQVSLAIRLFNYGNTNVANAIVTLDHSFLPGEIYGSFPPVYLSVGERVRLENDFIIPDDQFWEWQTGAVPRASVEFLDAAGNECLGPVPLARMLIGKEE